MLLRSYEKYCSNVFRYCRWTSRNVAYRGTHRYHVTWCATSVECWETARPLITATTWYCTRSSDCCAPSSTSSNHWRITERHVIWQPSTWTLTDSVACVEFDLRKSNITQTELIWSVTVDVSGGERRHLVIRQPNSARNRASINQHRKRLEVVVLTQH